MSPTRLLLAGVLAALALAAAACGDRDAGEEPAQPSATQRRIVTPPDSFLEMPFPETHSTFVSLPQGYRLETVLDGLEAPAAIAALPDGRLLIAEQMDGRVRVVEDGDLLDEPWFETPVSYPTGEFIQELGLVGVAVDPRFETNGYVYVYFTEENDDGERQTVFARLREEDGRGEDFTVLLTLEWSTRRTHVAGAIAFDGDDAILLGVGDHEEATSAPDLSVPIGKILRIDREGEALPDNPFVFEEDADPRIYAYGVRNPFGIAVDRETGDAYFTDNRAIAGDALYELERGATYGWPEQRVALREPLVIYAEPKGAAAAIVYRGDELSAFDGDVLFCTFHQGGVLHWSEPEELTGFDVFMRDRIIAAGCSSGLIQGADGFVYYLDYGAGRLLRISR